MLKKSLLAAVLLGLSPFAGATVAATPAFAAPESCQTGSYNDLGYAYCDGGTGVYRVKIRCQVASNLWNIESGPWVYPGHEWSTRICSRGFLTSVWYQVG
jgi:hypothetical protein